MTKILVINPGSTSTKFAVYEGEKTIVLKTLRHSAEELEPFHKVSEQYEFRKDLILNSLKEEDVCCSDFTAIIGRGGLINPVESGTYEVNEALKRDLLAGVQGEHASNLGGLIAAELAHEIPGCRAFIADPVVVDEMQNLARVSGHPKFKRKSIFHALNQKAMARYYAQSNHKKYEDLNLIVAHMGGGVSVGAHKRGRIIDVNNAVDGYGPFTPERAGTVPAGDLAKLCFSGEVTLDEVMKMLNGQGGLMAHLGSNQAHVIADEARGGDQKADLILSAMAYTIGKEIGSLAPVLEGKIDAIILTGGIAHNDFVVSRVKKMIEFLAPIIVYPGEDEMKALLLNAIAVLKGEQQCKEYK